MQKQAAIVRAIATDREKLLFVQFIGRLIECLVSAERFYRAGAMRGKLKIRIRPIDRPAVGANLPLRCWRHGPPDGFLETGEVAQDFPFARATPAVRQNFARLRIRHPSLH